MTVLLGFLTFFAILGTLVLVHELGHFSMAKLFGIRIEEFGVGFPPRVRSWRRGGTIYSLNALPLGGFVRMTGENGEQSDPAAFGAKPHWQRLIVLAAGPTMNLVLAVSIFFFSFLSGIPRQNNIVTGVARATPASRAGLRAGDRIVAVDGVRVTWGDDLHAAVSNHLGQRVTLAVRRGHKYLTMRVTARKHPPSGQGSLGVELASSATIHYSPAQSLEQSVGVVGTMVSTVPQVFANLFAPSSGVAGPIGIAHITTDYVAQEPKQGPGTLLTLMALLSANLGVLNLLPFPALDGGRIAFVAVSWVRRRNLDPQVEGAIHAAGMALLLLLIIVISYNDVVRWVTGGST